MFASLCRQRSKSWLVDFNSHSFKPDWYPQLARQTRPRGWCRFRHLLCPSALSTSDLASLEQDQSYRYLSSRGPNNVALIGATHPSIPTQPVDWNRCHVWFQWSRANHGFTNHDWSLNKTCLGFLTPWPTRGGSLTIDASWYDPALVAWKLILMARCYIACHCHRRESQAYSMRETINDPIDLVSLYVFCAA
jgi:hypothetical protein